jgi:hypothetical protein
MNEENFQKFTNRNKKKFRNENGRKRNQRDRRNTRYQGKQIIDDLISDGNPEYNRHNNDDQN